jgi:hypothetical protein
MILIIPIKTYEDFFSNHINAKDTNNLPWIFLENNSEINYEHP